MRENKKDFINTNTLKINTNKRMEWTCKTCNHVIEIQVEFTTAMTPDKDAVLLATDLIIEHLMTHTYGEIYISNL